MLTFAAATGESADCGARVSGPQPTADSNPAASHRLLYCFHSAPGLAINIKTEAPCKSLTARGVSSQPPFLSQDATFKLRKGALTVDGSFITEVHVVAETGRKGKEGELVHATFWADELKCELPYGPRPDTSF